MKRRPLLLALPVLVVAAAAAAFMWLALRPALPSHPLDIAPRESIALLHMRPADLVASQAFQRLVVERGHASGMQGVADTCGFNPLEQVDELVLVVLPGKDAGDGPNFAFALRGSLQETAMIGCIRKVLGKRRGAKVELGEVAGFPALLSAHGDSVAAFVRSGEAVAGSRVAVERLLGRLDDSVASAREQPGMVAAWQRAAGNEPRPTTHKEESPPVASLTVAASMEGGLPTLPIPGVAALLGEVGRLLGEPRMVAGALWVDDPVQGELEMELADPSGAQGLAGSMRQRVAGFAGHPLVRFSPAGAILDKLEIQADGPWLGVRAMARVAQIGTLVDLLPTARKLIQGAGASPAPVAPGSTGNAVPGPVPSSQPASPGAASGNAARPAAPPVP